MLMHICIYYTINYHRVCLFFSPFYVLLIWIFPGDAAGGDGGEAAPSEGEAAE